MERPKKTKLCSVEATLSVIGGKWKTLILQQLFQGTRRFGELGRAIPCVTPQMLAQHLRELETDGIIHRQMFAQIPPRVDYSLTEYGRTLHPLLLAMQAWGEQFLERSADKD